MSLVAADHWLSLPTDDPVQCELRNQLITAIINPLRECGHVAPADLAMWRRRLRFELTPPMEIAFLYNLDRHAYWYSQRVVDGVPQEPRYFEHEAAINAEYGRFKQAQRAGQRYTPSPLTFASSEGNLEFLCDFEHWSKFSDLSGPSAAAHFPPHYYLPVIDPATRQPRRDLAFLCRDYYTVSYADTCEFLDALLQFLRVPSLLRIDETNTVTGKVLTETDSVLRLTAPPTSDTECTLERLIRRKLRGGDNETQAALAARLGTRSRDPPATAVPRSPVTAPAPQSPRGDAPPAAPSGGVATGAATSGAAPAGPAAAAAGGAAEAGAATAAVTGEVPEPDLDDPLWPRGGTLKQFSVRVSGPVLLITLQRAGLDQPQWDPTAQDYRVKPNYRPVLVNTRLQMPELEGGHAVFELRSVVMHCYAHFVTATCIPRAATASPLHGAPGTMGFSEAAAPSRSCQGYTTTWVVFDDKDESSPDIPRQRWHPVASVFTNMPVDLITPNKASPLENAIATQGVLFVYVRTSPTSPGSACPAGPTGVPPSVAPDRPAPIRPAPLPESSAAPPSAGPPQHAESIELTE